jgi:hypothetical protein
LISIIAGVVALVTGFGVTRSRRTTADIETSDPTSAAGPCDRLRRLHAQARADADAKRTAAAQDADREQQQADADGGCFPEGNVERRVMETFDKTVKINHWVTVRPTSDAPSEARRISGELAWWRDVFATTSSAINVAGAVKGLVTRTTRDAAETAASGASVIAGDELGIDIPTTIYQVPVVVLEGAAAASSAIIKAWGGWIEKNHVEWVTQWGYQVRDCKLAWVEIWKCENGVKKCVERVLEVDIDAPRLTGAVETETYQPREQWQGRVDRKTRNHATRVRTDSQALTTFMQKHTVGPCSG